MLALIIAATLAAPGSCQQRCATDADRCYTGCKTSASCSRHCDDKSSDCSARCASDKAKARAEADEQASALPCDRKPMKNGRDREIKPCTEAEAKMFKDALNSAEARKALKCKDEKGRPMPCKSDEEKAEELVKAAGDEKAICKDADGNPRLCAEAQKRVEKAMKPGPSSTP